LVANEGQPRPETGGNRVSLDRKWPVRYRQSNLLQSPLVAAAYMAAIMAWMKNAAPST